MGLHLLVRSRLRKRRDREWAADARRRLDDAEQARAQIAWLYALYEAPSAGERKP